MPPILKQYYNHQGRTTNPNLTERLEALKQFKQGEKVVVGGGATAYFVNSDAQGNALVTNSLGVGVPYPVNPLALTKVEQAKK